MTKEEAKTKWCPMAAAIQARDGVKRTCASSECMAFRETRMEDDPMREGRVFAYCGLAGKP
jgi:hypothetical protein